MAGDGTWLTLGEVLARLRAAGYHDGESTVRRDIDAGIYGVEGTGWYKTERGGHRRIRAKAVDERIAERKKPRPPAD